MDGEVKLASRPAAETMPWTGERARILRSSFASLLGSGIVGVSQVAVLLVLARLSNQEATGSFAALTSLFLLAQAVARLGVPTTLVFFVSRVREPGSGQKVRRLAILGTGPVILAASVVALALSLVGASLIPLVGGESDQGHSWLLAMAWMLPAAAVLDCLLGVSQGMRQIRPTVVVDQLFRPLLQLALVALVVIAGHPYLAAAAWALPYVPAAVLAGVWLYRQIAEMPVDLSPAIERPDHTEKGEFWSYSWARWVAGIVQMGLQRVDIILVAGLAGIRAAAVYTAATRFVVLGQTIQLSIGRVVSPRLSKSLAANDIERARMLYATTTTWLVLLVWPIFLGIALLAVPLMDLFGPGYEDGVIVVWILAGAMLLATGVGLADIVLIMDGHSALGLRNQIAALVTMLLLDVALIPSYGVTGAAIGWAGGLAVRSLLPLSQNRRRLGIDPFARSTVTAGLLAVVCFGLVGWSVLLVTHGGWGFIGAMAAASVCYLFGVCLFRRSLELELTALWRRKRA